MDVLVGRTANQVVGAVAGNLRDPEVGAVEPRSVQLAKVEGGRKEGEAGHGDEARKREGQACNREKGRPRNRKRSVAG